MKQMQSSYNSHIIVTSISYEIACELTTNSSRMQRDYLQIVVSILLKKLNGLSN